MITYRNLGRLGRLGNELFQYAGTRLYAHEHGFSYAFPAWDGSRVLFSETPEWSLRQRMIASLLPTMWLDDLQHTNLFQRIRESIGASSRISMQQAWKSPRDNVNFYGYLQDDFSIALLKKHRTLVQSWFLFKKDFNDACASVAPSHPWTGIHIRRGDFLKRKLALSPEIIQDHLRKNQSTDPIYIASDDPMVHSSFKDFPVITIRPPSGISSVYFDFWMLTHSKLVYGCGSTFSWWAAFLSDSLTYISPPLTHTWKQGVIPPLAEQKLQ